MDEETKQALREELKQIDALNQSETPDSCRIIDQFGRYLSGYPYLWSRFGERTFVFRNQLQAIGIIERYRLQAKVLVKVRYEATAEGR